MPRLVLLAPRHTLGGQIPSSAACCRGILASGSPTREKPAHSTGGAQRAAAQRRRDEGCARTGAAARRGTRSAPNDHIQSTGSRRYQYAIEGAAAPDHHQHEGPHGLACTHKDAPEEDEPSTHVCTPFALDRPWKFDGPYAPALAVDLAAGKAERPAKRSAPRRATESRASHRDLLQQVVQQARHARHGPRGMAQATGCQCLLPSAGLASQVAARWATW